jgi:hypothetical protein
VEVELEVMGRWSGERPRWFELARMMLSMHRGGKFSAVAFGTSGAHDCGWRLPHAWRVDPLLVPGGATSTG